jgi:hypothetical protein
MDVPAPRIVLGFPSFKSPSMEPESIDSPGVGPELEFARIVVGGELGGSSQHRKLSQALRGSARQPQCSPPLSQAATGLREWLATGLVLRRCLVEMADALGSRPSGCAGPRTGCAVVADAPDSKSGPRKRVWVQVQPSVLYTYGELQRAELPAVVTNW